MPILGIFKEIISTKQKQHKSFFQHNSSKQNSLKPSKSGKVDAGSLGALREKSDSAWDFLKSS